MPSVTGRKMGSGSSSGSVRLSRVSIRRASSRHCPSGKREQAGDEPAALANDQTVVARVFQQCEALFLNHKDLRWTVARGLHAQAASPSHVPPELAVPLLRLLAQLSEFLGIVENMGESFLALAWVQGPGRWLIERVSESLLFFFAL